MENGIVTGITDLKKIYPEILDANIKNYNVDNWFLSLIITSLIDILIITYNLKLTKEINNS